MLELTDVLASLCFMWQVVVSNHSDLYTVVKINAVNIKTLCLHDKTER